MSSKQKESLAKLLIIGGALSFAYLMVNYFSKPSNGRKNLKIGEIHRVLKEIKYQVYANCISFSEGIKATIANKSSKPLPQEVEQKLRGQLIKTYDAKETLILKKYDISKEDFANALKTYKNDKVVKADQAEIVKVMEDTLKGDIDITTSPQVQRINSFAQIIKLHHNLCLQIGIKVWEKLDHHKRNNPNFDSKNDEDFRSAIRQLNIYDFKVGYLKNIGYREEWGCPNLNLLKLVETAKRGNPQHKIEAICIEKAYETVIAKVSNEPESYNRGKVEDLFEQIRSDTRKALKPQPQVKSEPLNSSTFKAAPAAQVPIVNSKPSPAPILKPKKDEEEQFDMEKLMMAQLLSRSQEQPKEQQKIEKKIQTIIQERPVSAQRKPQNEQRPSSALKESQNQDQERPSSALRKVDAQEEERPGSAPRIVDAQEEVKPEEKPVQAPVNNEKIQQYPDQRIPEVEPVAQVNEVKVQQNSKPVQMSEVFVSAVEQVQQVIQEQKVAVEAVPVNQAQPLEVVEQIQAEQPKVVEQQPIVAEAHEQAKVQEGVQANHEQHVRQQIKQVVQQKVEIESHEKKPEHQAEEHIE